MVNKTIYKKFYLLNEFTEESLQKVAETLIEVNRKTNNNDFNFYDIEDLIVFENVKQSVVKQINDNKFGIKFVKIEIDSFIHDVNKKRKIMRNALDSFTGLYCSVILHSEIYEISYNNVVKITAKKSVELTDVKFDFEIR